MGDDYEGHVLLGVEPAHEGDEVGRGLGVDGPRTIPAYLAAASGLSPQPAAVVRAGVFQPEWMRVGVGGCILLDNFDGVAYRLGAPTGARVLAAHYAARYCFGAAGIVRIQLNRVPYTGGWVIVDQANRG